MLRSELATVVTSSPTHVGFDVHVVGRAAHAAVNPQDGERYSLLPLSLVNFLSVGFR